MAEIKMQKNKNAAEAAALWAYEKHKDWRRPLLVIDYDAPEAVLVRPGEDGTVVIGQRVSGKTVSFFYDLEKLLLERCIQARSLGDEDWTRINKRMARYIRNPDRQKDLRALDAGKDASIRCAELMELFDKGGRESLAGVMAEGVRMWETAGLSFEEIRFLPIGATAAFLPAVYLLYDQLQSDYTLRDDRILLDEHFNRTAVREGSEMFGKFWKKTEGKEKEEAQKEETERKVYPDSLALLLLDREGKEVQMDLARKGALVPDKGKELYTLPFLIHPDSLLTILVDGRRQKVRAFPDMEGREPIMAAAAAGITEDGKSAICLKYRQGSKAATSLCSL